jgi:3-deoxy-D-manno-octulosonic acid (KDO) 8-phosphate synthase
MVPLKAMEELLRQLIAFDQLAKELNKTQPAKS